MYVLFTLLAGLCQAAMMSLNGVLTRYIGQFGMSLMVHLIGGLLLVLFMLFQKEKISFRGLPWYLYSGGFFGIFLVITSSLCINRIGAALTTCLSIAGQILISALIDHFGWFGVPRIPFNPRRLPAFALISAGLVLLILA